MSLDRLTLRGYLAELGPLVEGRRIEKARTYGKGALKLELSSRDLLFLDVSRSLAGVWLVGRAAGVPDDPRDVEGPSRTAALLFRKHLEGARIDRIQADDARNIRILTSRATVVLRSQNDPAATLFVEDLAIANFGVGAPVVLSRSFDEVSPSFEMPAAEALVRSIAAAPRDERRAILAATDPGLLPLLRRWPETERAMQALAETLAGSRPAAPCLSPQVADDARNSERPPMLLPFEPDGDASRERTFVEAACRVYVSVRRAELFRDRCQAQFSRARADCARLGRLKAALDRDRGRWPDPAVLRLHAEALLAAPPQATADRAVPHGRDVEDFTIPDPWRGEPITVRIHPAMTLPQNANAFFAKARAIEKQKGAFDERWEAVVDKLTAAEATLEALKGVRTLEGVDAPTAEVIQQKTRYLTSRGLEMIFGRSASENHDVTFKLAKREDIWFHVLDAPGGHVVLRNREGRANREDIAEAASLAAFLSERRTEDRVDVQYTERKHVHPAGGGKGRVRVAHAEVIRVSPQDPAGRLRAR